MHQAYVSKPYKHLSRAEVQLIKETYPAGTKIRLDEMPNDPNPIASGSTGIVNNIDDQGGLAIDWDGFSRSLRLLPGVDKFTVLERPKTEYFLMGSNSVFDLGAYESREACMKSNYYNSMGGGKYPDLLLVNRAEAHEVMRQLKLKLSRYDNSMFKQ